MPIKKNKISYFYDLSDQLEGVTSRQEREAIKARAGDILLDEVMEFTAKSNSPVKGKGRFKALSKEYKAVKKKQGKGTKANLRLDLDMLPSIKVVKKKDGVELTITDSIEKKKAYNHIVGDTVPSRSFLPDDAQSETFKKPINDRVNREINAVKDDFNGSEI